MKKDSINSNMFLNIFIFALSILFLYGVVDGIINRDIFKVFGIILLTTSSIKVCLLLKENYRGCLKRNEELKAFVEKYSNLSSQLQRRRAYLRRYKR